MRESECEPLSSPALLAYWGPWNSSILPDARDDLGEPEAETSLSSKALTYWATKPSESLGDFLEQGLGMCANIHMCTYKHKVANRVGTSHVEQPRVVDPAGQ